MLESLKLKRLPSPTLASLKNILKHCQITIQKATA